MSYIAWPFGFQIFDNSGNPVSGAKVNAYVAGSSSTLQRQDTYSTEAAGANIVAYLPLIFLALIFGVILIIVLRVILPYINVTRGMDGI